MVRIKSRPFVSLFIVQYWIHGDFRTANNKQNRFNLQIFEFRDDSYFSFIYTNYRNEQQTQDAVHKIGLFSAVSYSLSTR